MGWDEGMREEEGKRGRGEEKKMKKCRDQGTRNILFFLMFQVEVLFDSHRSLIDCQTSFGPDSAAKNKQRSDERRVSDEG